jgi:hypothetical protein
MHGPVAEPGPLRSKGVYSTNPVGSTKYGAYPRDARPRMLRVVSSATIPERARPPAPALLAVSPAYGTGFHEIAVSKRRFAKEAFPIVEHRAGALASPSSPWSTSTRGGRAGPTPLQLLPAVSVPIRMPSASHTPGRRTGLWPRLLRGIGQVERPGLNAVSDALAGTPPRASGRRFMLSFPLHNCGPCPRSGEGLLPLSRQSW